MHKGVDCSARLTAERAEILREEGYTFIGRYLVPFSRAKAVKPEEARIILGAGLGLLLCWELTDKRIRGGAAVGQSDGETARSLAEQLGAPPGTAIYFAADYDVPRADFDAIEAYLRAAGKAIGEYACGVYGPFKLIETMAERGVCRGYWQCVGWSGLLLSPAYTVYQQEWQYSPEAQRMARRLGFYVDINTCPDLERAGIWRETMTGEEIYTALQAYAAQLPPPEWAEKELAEAAELGITDGERPMQLVPRYQAAIMALRAVKAARGEMRK